MHPRTFSPTQQRQRGYTLIEILVAVAIFATVMIVALLLYDQSNRVFKQANESAEMQQNTRVAYEKIVADLRMAGFDYKRAGTPSAGLPSTWAPNRDYNIGSMVTPKTPNGHVYRAIKAGTSGPDPGPTFPTGAGAKVTDNTVEWQEYGAGVYEQPDEQIEYAHKAAITIRANFDYEDPSTVDQGREPELEKLSNGRFPVITTGNDEIVTYALVSRSGNANANKDTISFFADVNNGLPEKRSAYPGGSAEREIKITGVDLTNLYPPYTLMRYTLNAKGEPVGTALADNIRSMEFSYWEDATARTALRDFTNVVITDFSTLGGLGKYDPSSPGALIKERLIRGKIRAVTATISGMNPQPDLNYTHPSDTVAKNYRQYSLQSTIVGRNLGLKGMPQSDTNPPPAPILENACSGYCGVVFLRWSPGAGSGDVTYTVLYDTSASGSFSNVLPAGSQTTYSVDLTQLDLSKTYYFRVAATNAAGTTVSAGSPVVVDPRNVTKPSPPAAVTATKYDANEDTSLPNAIAVTWAAPTTNASGAPSCQPAGAAVEDLYPVEIRGYRVKRSTDPNFDPAKEGDLVVDVNSTAVTFDASTNQYRFVDTGVANCTPYYYRVAAVEWCEANAAYNQNGNAATGASDYSPAAQGEATSTQAPKAPTNFKQTVESVCDESTNNCGPVTLTWDKVTRDVTGEEIVVMNYRIYRQRKVNGANDPSIAEVGGPSNGETTYTDASSLPMFNSADPSQKYTYEYTIYAWQCKEATQKSAVATLLYPGTCVTGADVVPDNEGLGSGTFDDPFEDVSSLTVVPHATKPFTSVEVLVDGPPYSTLPYPYVFDWDIQDGEVHRVSFRVRTADCVETLTVWVRANPADCAITAAASNVIGTPNQVQLVLTNTSQENVTLTSFDITWAGQFGYTWDTIRFPGGNTAVATPVPPATTSTPRTVRFTPPGSDKTIAKGASYRILLNFTGLTTAVPSTVTGFSVQYKEGNGSTQFGCAPRVVSCAVAATVTAPANGTSMFVNVKNNSDETLTVTRFSIRWNGQSDWAWGGVTAGNTIDINPDATSATTQTFTPTGFSIEPGGTGVITMNMVPTKNNPNDLLATTVGDVILEYTTASSGTVTALTCRAK